MGSPSDRRGRRMLVKPFRWWRWDCSALGIVRYLKMLDITKKMHGKEGGYLTMVTMESAVASRWRGWNNRSRSRTGARNRVGVCDDLVASRG